MKGKRLGQRYELQEKVGGGGMALVYKAEDTYLNRPVAVKMLRPQFAEDEEFLTRFRREAQSAARLSHPNVVNVYDVGQEGTSHYIVMEYVEGPTLKQLIREKGPLPPGLAVKIAYQICEALDHAHRNKVVHRDIKPHNILVMPSGRVKVTDFGIARAVTDNTLTNTGNIIGSVHYFSPEQARGGFTGERSDLYSLGVVLYEMLTGTVPFKGESPFSIAIKHLQEDVVPPSVLCPDVPPELEAVVMRALEKDADTRYQSASEIMQDLNHVFKDLDTFDEGDVGGYLGSGSYRNRDVSGRVVPKKPKPRSINYLWVGALLVLLGMVIYGVKFVQDWMNVPVIEVPDVVGVSLSEAQDRLKREGLSGIVVAEKNDDEIESGLILSQDPEAGESVKQGREIKLIVSLGPEMVAIPNLFHKPFREADLVLKSEGLDFGNVAYQHNSDHASGTIVSQSPRPGTMVSRGTLVDLVVSKGPEPRETVMVNLVGLTYEDALERLKELDLEKGTVTEEPSTVYPKGFVIAHTPGVGDAIKEGASVDLTVSSGGATPKQKDLIIALPVGGDSPLEVRVDLHDITGEQVVYTERHKPGDVIRLTVQWYGPEARALIYLDGTLHRESILRS